jgi:hypothetical protein
MGQALPQVALLLLDPVPLDRLRLGGAILLPVAGMVGAPLASAVAADLTILHIAGELLPAVLATTPLLTRLVRTDGLLQVKSGWFKLPLAETATSLFHPFRVGGAVLSGPRFPEKTLHWKGINPADSGPTSVRLGGLAG